MKYFVLAVLLVLFPSMALCQDLPVNVITQSSWPPGKYVPVRIEIANPGSDGFARFYQDLPQGFTVKSAETAGADFYWENMQVNFVWLKMPADKVVSISYLAKADAALSGSFRLGGRLDYLTDGDTRKSVECESLVIYLDRKAEVEEDMEGFFREEEDLTGAAVKKVDIAGTEDATVKGDTAVKDDAVVKEKSPSVVFRVQVAIASEQVTQKELEERIDCSLEHGITVLTAGSMFKYQSGTFKTYPEAAVYLEELKGRGLDDAFIVAYRDSEQISVNLARTLTE